MAQRPQGWTPIVVWECDLRDMERAAIGDEMRGWRQGAEHQAGPLVVAHLAFRQEQDDRPAVTVADGVELGVQPALGSPDTTGNIPFLSRLAAVR